MRDQVLPGAEACAYQLWVHNIDARGTTREEIPQVRLFPRLPGIRFQNAVHEELVTSLERTGLASQRTPLVIVHTGYASPDLLRQKHARNEALLRKSMETNGESVHNLVHLAHAVGATGRIKEAEGFVNQALDVERAERNRPQFLAELHAFRAMLRTSLAQSFAASHDLEQAISLWPEWGVPYGMLAELRMQQEDLTGAWEAIERARGTEYPPSSVGMNVRRAQSRLEWTLGCLLFQQERIPEAISSCRRSLETDPTYLAARLRLGQLLLDAEDFAAAREVLEPAGEDEAAVSYFVDVASAISLARAMTGDMAGAAACLSPLLDIFADQLGGAQDVGPVELAAAALQTGFAAASRNLLTLFEKTLAVAA
jgi:tetratricopeptide (TPR) repeat protein